MDLLIWIFWALCAIGAASVGLLVVVAFVGMAWRWLLGALALALFFWWQSSGFPHGDMVMLAVIVMMAGIIWLDSSRP